MSVADMTGAVRRVVAGGRGDDDPFTPEGLDREGQRLWRIWKAFPPTPVDEDRAHEIIMEALGLPAYRAIDASVLPLTATGVLEVVRVPGGERYRRAEAFPKLSDALHNGPGSDAYNEQLGRLAAEERARKDKAEEEARRDYQMNSPAARERREDIALIEDIVGPLRERVEALEHISRPAA